MNTLTFYVKTVSRFLLSAGIFVNTQCLSEWQGHTRRAGRTFAHLAYFAVCALVCISPVVLDRSAIAATAVTLHTDFPEGNPMIIDAGTVSETAMNVSVAGNLLTGLPSDGENTITAWQTMLLVLPDASATGTVQFNSAIEPDNYLFSSIDTNGIFPASTLPPLPHDRVLVADFNFPYSGGTEVPGQPETSNLVAIDFIASADSSGLFGVFAVPSGSEWIDATEPDFGTHSFSNLPGQFPAVQIGQLSVRSTLPQLQPGDSDMDLDFDQLDLLKVLRGAKYRTGQGATWGEGDWDGAPGGSPGNPPTGNGFFDQFDVLSALKARVYNTGSYAVLNVRPPLIGSRSLVHGLTSFPESGDVPLHHIPVPEPASHLLAVCSVLLLLFYRRKH